MSEASEKLVKVTDDRSELKPVQGHLSKAAPASAAPPEVLGDLLSLDDFVTTTRLPAAWADGLQIWLRTRGELTPKPRAEWDELLATYKKLS